MIADPKTFALVGPWGSGGRVQGDPGHQRGRPPRVQPGATDQALTKPRDGALDLRAAHPDRINFIRTAPADDIQGPALASFVFRDLGAKRTLVIDDGDAGREIADGFSVAYQKLGGEVVRRTLNKGADPASVLDPLTGPDAAVGGVLRRVHRDRRARRSGRRWSTAGTGAVPFLSWDGISGRDGRRRGSFLQLAGPAAAGSYFSHATVRAAEGRLRRARTSRRFGAEPDEYTASAYACAQVISTRLRAVAATGPSADAVCATPSAPTPSTRAIATRRSSARVGFDANGDSLQQFVTFYRVDPSAAGGKGDWVIDKQQDYGPAP